MRKRWFAALSVATSIFMAALPVHANGGETIILDRTVSQVSSQFFEGSTAELYIEGWSTNDEINWYILDQSGTLRDYGYVGSANHKYDQFTKYYPGAGSLQLVLECSGRSCDGSGSIYVHW